MGCLRHFEAALAANRSLEAEEGISYKDTDVRVTECPDKSICCGWYNTTCCNKKEGVWIKDGFATTVDPSVARYLANETSISSPIHPTSNSLSPTSLTSLPSPLPLESNSPPQSKPGVSRGQAVGVGIGSACGTAIILISLYGLRRCFRSQRPSFPEQQKDFTPVQEQQGITGVPNYELSGMVVRNELGGLNRVELGI